MLKPPRPMPVVVRRPGPSPLPPVKAPLREFSPAADPLAGVKYTGDVDQDVKAELGALEAAFRDRGSKELTRMSNEIDSENWFSVVFETREQKEDFLSRIAMLELGDKYFDGRDFAKRMGIELQPSGREYRPEGRIDGKLAALADPVKYRG